MPQPSQHQWPETHEEQTDVFAPSMVVPRENPVETPRPPGPRPAVRRAGIIAGAVVAAFAVLYAIDLVVSNGDLPRGVTVAGVEVGGLTRVEAEQRLRDRIEPRVTQPVRLRVGEVDDQLDPVASGLRLDWRATLDRAGDQPLNPFTRLVSFFHGREVGVATSTDDAALGASVEAVRVRTARQPVEGGVRFDGATPVAVEPKAGQELDAQAARGALLQGWANGTVVGLPVRAVPMLTTPQGVRDAVDQLARPAVAAPVTVHGEGKDATLEPAAIAGALLFEPDGRGGLRAKVDQAKVIAAVQPQLAGTEQEGRDAQIVFDAGKPTVRPSQDGRGVNWDTSLGGLLDVLKKPTGRELTAQYTAKPAKVTTEAAKQLGITAVVSEFTTGGFAVDSGQNIRTVAQKVGGAIVRPGETFSLNGFTGPRTAAQGYVEAGVIKDGAPAREIGGGISQFATTLYNAAYFAAMKDAGHKEHSYYISRYPPAREATVFQNPDGSSVIDLKFTNDSPTGVAIQTVWTPTTITVRIWGTKRYTVESIPGPRTNLTEPQEKPGPAVNCHTTNGIQGFTTTDTRVIKDLAGYEVRRSTRTVRYNPQPKITCGPPA